MHQKGYSLVEVLVVIGIVSALGAIATLGFTSMRQRSQIDAEAKEIYGEIMAARSEALFRKTTRSLKLTTQKQLSVYESSDGTGTVIRQKTFKDAVSSNNTSPLAFDATGMASDGAGTVGIKTFCVGDAGNAAGVDSIIVQGTTVLIGKRTGGSCTSANITPR